MSNNWADELAEELLGYLRLCKTPKDEREIIAAYFRRERVAGKMIGSHELATALGVKSEETKQ